jgi:hypothetical protein
MPWQKSCGEFKRITTDAPGVEISEILPSVAKVMKHLTIVRSLVTNEGSHERGTYLMNTGRVSSPVVQYPSVGAMVSHLAGDKTLALPGFIGVGGTAQRIGSGYLGMMYAPFTVQNPGQPPANIAAPGGLGKLETLTERQRRRQRLFYGLEHGFAKGVYPHLSMKKTEKENHLAREKVGSPADAHEAIYRKGFDLTISPLRDVFDIRKEQTKTIDLYGGRQNNFGMGCLLARRLVEKGVSCVEVDLGGWDMHNGIFNALRRPNGQGQQLDKGLSGLVTDLVQRGLWKNTVVLWVGDFGRTPAINQNNGRDHWPQMSVVLGGGLIKGGQVYGSTTADGRAVKDNKCLVPDLFATVYKGLGLDPKTSVRDNLGRPGPIAAGAPLKGVV